MYGIIGQLNATPGNGQALAAIFKEDLVPMNGCVSYVVATDPKEPDTLWITEVWASKEDHAASLQLPAVQEMIGRARPLIAGFGQRVETEPVIGLGFANEDA